MSFNQYARGGGGILPLEMLEAQIPVYCTAVALLELVRMRKTTR